MGALGLEPRTYVLKGRCENDISAVNKGLTETEQSDFAICLANLLQEHPELEQIIAVWAELPEHIKQTIETLVGSVTPKNEEIKLPQLKLVTVTQEFLLPLCLLEWVYQAVASHLRSQVHHLRYERRRSLYILRPCHS